MNLDSCKVIKTRHASFFHCAKEAEVVLFVCTYTDGSEIGKVTCEGNTLNFGSKAEDFFNAMAAKQEADYMILRAKVRAVTNFHPKYL